MANKISLEVELKSKLEQSKSDLSSLKKEKVFNGPAGEKTLTKINGLLQRLESVDLKGLKGPELTKFLTELSKLRSMLDSSSRTLTAYTDAFKKQQDVVNDAVKNLNKQKELKSEKLKAKKEALSNVNLKGHTYFNKKTAREVTNIDTIVDLMNSDGLEIRGLTGKKAVTADNQKKILENTGLNKYANASKEYEIAKQEVATQETNVKTEKLNLEKVSNPTEIHPVTEQVQQNSASTERFISNIRQQEDEQDESYIKETTDAINKQIPAIEKQTSSLGKAFKQFTIYNIAVRSVKTALREAVQTVKELDKYLTEQAMVTGMTREQTYGLVKSYQNLALQCGATTKEIAQVATEYMKQGKSIQESLTLTEAAVKAAKVARVSVGDSVNYLTTALNGFRLSAEDAMKVSDKFAAVAAASATDYDELAIALSKVASQANLAGMSIDYTTALLTKGLETTREAPETMGTALKTIIARMRELGDYGETLGGDTDINKVESQLAYVGIALRDQQGELRSTEEVLDELGHKWDTLNKNQQAALAKALAGTRQQSRLIAMMDDYERVIELQEISERSAGATAAQAETYLDGIEAALNNIQVSWEKIVMTVSDSEFIIGILQFVGDTLDKIGNFLSTDFGLIATLTMVGILTTTALGNKLKEIELSKLQQKFNILKQKSLASENIASQKLVVTEKKKALAEAEAALVQVEKNKATLSELKAKRAILAAEGKSTAAADSAIAMLEAEIKMNEQAVQQATEELNQEELKLSMYEKENELLNAQESLVSRIFTGFSALSAPLMMVITLWKTISGLITMVGAKQDAQHKKTMAQKLQENSMNATVAAGKIIGNLGVWGIPLAIAVAAALAGVALAIGAGIKNAQANSTEGTVDKINELGNEIYKLTEKANELDKIGDSFDEIDKKIIKTNEDLEEMSSLLGQAADKLDEEEKKIYESLTTDKQKREYIEQIEQESRDKANNNRTEIIKRFARLNNSDKERILNSKNNAEYLGVQSQIYAINNSELYNYIDFLETTTDITTEHSSAVRQLTQNILEEMTAEEAWSFAQERNAEKLINLTKSVESLKIKLQDLSGTPYEVNVADALTSDDYTLKEKVKAYQSALMNISDTSAQAAFKTVYSQYEYFSDLTDNALDFLDKKGLGGDKLNELGEGWKVLQKAGVDISEETWKNKFKFYIEALAETQGDVLQATKSVFGTYLRGNEKALNAFVSAYGNVIQVGILNMGQEMDKIKNTVNSFYEKALDWNEMSESDKAEFLQDNADLFAGDGGKKLLRAFETGDYNQIAMALENNEGLLKRIEDQKEKVRQELIIEEARTGEDRNNAYIAQLKQYQNYLNDTVNLFKASLEARLQQEQEQLDEYRSYLEEQQEALEESLTKRKEAYEKYFDEVNQEEEDNDYEEEANQLVTNLSKLASSTNAASIQQTKELEQQLKELEEERLKELRERAQEAILENMDDTIEEINEKFSKLLESNQALLVAMQGELKDPLSFVTDLISNKIEQGATALEVEDFISSLQTTYDSVLDDNVNWDAISVREENNQLFLTVNGTDIKLDTSNEQNLYAAIMRALTEVGLR